MRRWLARLSFSFAIIAAVLFWEGYKATGRTGLPPRVIKTVLCFIGAGASMVLAAAGTRERHRQD